MGSIVMGALGGAGEQLADIGTRRMQSDLDTQRDIKVAGVKSDLEIGREKTLLLVKNEISVNSANQQRDAQVGRIDAAAGTIADKAGADKRSIIQGGIADKDSWTPEMQAAVDQSLAQDRGKAVTDPKVRTQAAIQTGDISPEKAATLTNNEELGQAKLENALKLSDMKTASQERIADLRAETMNARTDAQYQIGMAKMEAALAKAGSGNTDFDKKIRLLKESGASDKELANFITDRKQPSMEDLANGFLKADPNLGTKKALTPEDAYAKAKTLRSLSKTLSDGDSDSKLKAAVGTPAPAASRASQFKVIR